MSTALENEDRDFVTEDDLLAGNELNMETQLTCGEENECAVLKAQSDSMTAVPSKPCVPEAGKETQESHECNATLSDELRRIRIAVEGILNHLISNTGNSVPTPNCQLTPSTTLTCDPPSTSKEAQAESQSKPINQSPEYFVNKNGVDLLKVRGTNVVKYALGFAFNKICSISILGMILGQVGKILGMILGQGGKIMGMILGQVGKIMGMILGQGGKIMGMILGQGGKIMGMILGQVGKILGMILGQGGKILDMILVMILGQVRQDHGHDLGTRRQDHGHDLGTRRQDLGMILGQGGKILGMILGEVGKIMGMILGQGGKIMGMILGQGGKILGMILGQGGKILDKILVHG
eukprot:Em0003g757a